MLVACRATLQRLTELRLVGHVFAAAEALESAMLLAGALLVPVLVSTAGINGTCLAIAGFCSRQQSSYCDRSPPQKARPSAPLNASPHYVRSRQLPRPRWSGDARVARTRGTATHLRRGQRTHDAGRARRCLPSHRERARRISQDGAVINHLGPGNGVGEIALLFPTPRTATVTATDEVNTLSLDRETFLLALTQQPPPTSVYASMHSRMARPEPIPSTT